MSGDYARNCLIAQEMRELSDTERKLRITWGVLAGVVIDARHKFEIRRMRISYEDTA